MNTCRFCKELTLHAHKEGVIYSTRHFAHFKCYLDAEKKLSDLHQWQRERFPYFLLKERGLLNWVGGEIIPS